MRKPEEDNAHVGCFIDGGAHIRRVGHSLKRLEIPFFVASNNAAAFLYLFQEHAQKGFRRLHPASVRQGYG